MACLILCLLALPASAPGRTAAPFHASLLPGSSTLEVGESAFVRFEADSTARQFDGYEITVEYDPAVIQFLGVDQGSLMTGACPSPAPFFVLAETDSSITISHVILCGGLVLDGPGVLAILRFAAVANGTSPLEITRPPDRTFVQTGVWINPDHPTFPRQVILHDAVIQVGAGAGAGGQAPASRMRLELNRPNPFNPSTRIIFHTQVAGPVAFEVWNGAGRLVWRRAWPHLPTGRHQFTWRGTDRRGTPLPSGIYLSTLRTPSGMARGKMILLR